jgi:hypothetical protein
MLGFDFDGVVTKGYRPKYCDVIITGCGVNKFAHVIKEMIKLRIGCPVYFNPYNDGSIETAAKWKSEMILRLKCERFYENDSIQVKIIQKNCPNCEVIKI